MSDNEKRKGKKLFTHERNCMSSLELSIKNGKELIEFFKDKWTKEELDKQLKLQELAEYNLSLWKDK